MPSRTVVFLAVVVSGLAIPSGGPLQSQAKRAMTLVDLLNIPRIDDPQISRDGRRIVFSMRTTDWAGNRRVPQIWQIGSDGTGLRRLTSIDVGAGGARWSPDGSAIAFLSRGQISVMPADGGSPRQLSQHATAVSDIAWHPDGEAIYFLANDQPTDLQREREKLRGDIRLMDEFRMRHLWRINVADALETRITRGDYSVFGYKLAANGRRIVIGRRPTPLPADTDRMELWSLSVDGSDSVQLTKNKIPEMSGEMSPDGSQVLFLARANDRLEPYYNASVFLVPATGGAVRALLQDFSYEVLGAGWSADGKSVWMVVNMGVHSELFQVDVKSGKSRQLTNNRHAVIGEPYWSVVNDRQVFVIDEPSRIGEVWTYSPADSEPVRVTRVYDYLDRDFALPRQERIEWKSIDGVTIEGLLTYPIDHEAGTRYPLLVQLHGGPETSDRFGWGSILYNYQPAWAGKGYAILRPNYRGSSGYGTAFYREPVGGYFKNSHLDVLAGVDRVIALGVADPDRLAVMGWSAGGHLVNKLITFTNRFKAAASGAGVANWISLYGQSDTRGDRDLWLGGTLWQKNAPIQTYWDQSPLKYVAAVRTPTLFLIGENDTRVPMAQSIEMHRAIRALGVSSELHIAPNEPHDWVQLRHQLHKMNSEMEWIEKFVRNLAYVPELPPSENDSKATPTP
jgi:dipeptidyl aminopeptidase/acylaminoacyl peptidase